MRGLTSLVGLFLLWGVPSFAGPHMIHAYWNQILADSSQMQAAGFTECVGSLSGDHSLTMTPVDYFSGAKLAERGEGVEFSTPIISDRLVWFVTGPKDSMVSRLQPFVGQRFPFVPDTFGRFRATLMHQNPDGTCSGIEEAFFAGVNKPPETAIDRRLTIPQMPWQEQIELETGSLETRGQGIVVAVIGTGIDYLNPELNQSLWSNACTSNQINCEIPGNGIDDDGNGLVDDIHGWDYVENNPNGYDYSAHETGVAGFIAGRSFGVAPESRVMNLKVSDNFLGSSLEHIGPAIRYAVDKGAHLINLSTGYFAYNPSVPVSVTAEIREAIHYADLADVAIVVSAGNGERLMPQDIDQIPFYPASWESRNLIVVGAVNAKNELAYYSNYGAQSVDVVAPGGELPTGLWMLSPESLRGSDFIRTQGTSFAAPIVAGSLALALSASPQRYFVQEGRLNLDRLIENLLTSGEPNPDLVGKVRSGRIFSLKSLLQKEQ